MRKWVIGLVIVVAFVFSVSTVMAQEPCEGNFDYDDDVDGSDAFTFKTDFGRSSISNPCPSDGPAPVPKTGQTACYDEDSIPRDCAGTSEDGEHQRGVVWPIPRFTDHEDGTATDNLTGLMW